MVTLARIVVLCWSAVFATYASGEEVYIARKKGTEVESGQVIEALSRAFLSALPGSTLKVGYSSDVTSAEKVVIAVGESALREVIESNTSARIVSAFISKATFESLMGEFPRDRKRVTAVYSDPSPERQLALIRVLLGAGSTVGILTTSQNSGEASLVSKYANRLGLKVLKGQVTADKTLREVFDEMRGAETLLLLRDKHVFEFVDLDDLIREAYDGRGMGVIGYSSVIVNNGGLGTTYSTSEDTAAEVGRAVGDILRQADGGESRYPAKYQIAINKYVVRSLGYRLVNESEITAEISQLVGEEGQ